LSNQGSQVAAAWLQALLAEILLLLELHVQTLQAEGFHPIEAAYIDNWLHTGQQVQILGLCDPLHN
jgi:biotin-(acetyl-CoA carboxylase) ligase